jgi:outer membrane biogenesis lipoprotein LolB
MKKKIAFWLLPLACLLLTGCGKEGEKHDKNDHLSAGATSLVSSSSASASDASSNSASSVSIAVSAGGAKKS